MVRRNDDPPPEPEYEESDYPEILDEVRRLMELAFEDFERLEKVNKYQETREIFEKLLGILENTFLEYNDPNDPMDREPNIY